MNVFGGFTFGGLIKIFLPGLVWLAALALIWNDLHAHWPLVPALPPIDGEEQNLLVLAVPVSILLGLLSNIVIFMGVNDVLIRHPARRRAPDLFRLHDWLVARIGRDCWRQVACTDATLTQPFLANADAELLILNRIGVDQLSYVREQYWYHMEFQVNLLTALVAALIGLLGAPAGSGDCNAYAACGALTGWMVRDAGEILLVGGSCCFLRAAGLKNYRRHVAKMCALMAAAVAADAKERA